jgi:hypothetical protein
MPIGTVLTLAAISAAFCAFGITLAWADYCSRGPGRS